MSRNEADRTSISTLRFDAMLNRLEQCVTQLIKNVDKVPIWAHAESILSYAKMWAGQTRKQLRSGLRIMTSRLEAVQRAIEESERCWRQLRLRVAELHKYKSELEETLAQKLSRLEFNQEKAEVDERLSAASATISSLEESVAMLKKIYLEVHMQVPSR
jgi:chromosome segregation ATPase